MRKILMVIVLLLGGAFTSLAQSGYRGFADIGLGAGFCEKAGFNALITTTHGYQCNGHIFVGGGIGVGLSTSGYDISDYDYFSDYVNIGFMVPIYAALRYDYSLTSKHSFFVSSKGGYVVGSIRAGFCSPEFGVRFGSMSRLSYNLSFKIDVLGGIGEDRWLMVAPMACFGIEF